MGISVLPLLETEPPLPPGWPAVDGELTCETCHYIIQQCSKDASRAQGTPKMLRRPDPERAAIFCRACHVDPAWEGGPHRQLIAEGRPDTDTCVVCHTEAPEIPAGGQREGKAQLRDADGSCWICHTQHWDYHPARHVNQLVAPDIRQQMSFPLEQDRIVCYTCHNPHQERLFPKGSPLGTWASSAPDRARYLRADRPQLCLECHARQRTGPWRP